MSPRFSLYARALGVLVTITISLFWSHMVDRSSSSPLLLGLYGEAPITIKCPRNGDFQIQRQRGDILVEGQEIIHIQSESLRLLKHEFTQKSIELRTALKRSLLSSERAFDLSASQRLDRIQQRQAELWGYRAQRAQAQAKIRTLTQELAGLKSAVKAGAAPLRDLLSIKAEIKSAQALIKPLKNQEFSQSKGEGEKGDQNLEHAQEKIIQTYQEELTSWRKGEQALEILIQKFERIRSPVNGIVLAAQVTDARRGSCLVGETLMTIQPTSSTLRLWQLNHLDQPVQIGTKLKARSALPVKMQTHVEIDADTVWVSSRVSALPLELQSAAQRELGLIPLFGTAPQMSGRLIEAHFKFTPSEQASGFNHALWGLPLVVKP